MTAQRKLSYKAKLLKRDHIESIKRAEMHVLGPGSSVKLMIDEVERSNPDHAKLKQWAEALSYLRFILNETQNLCEEVLKITR